MFYSSSNRTCPLAFWVTHHNDTLTVTMLIVYVKQNKIEMVQRRAVRYVCNSFTQYSFLPHQRQRSYSTKYRDLETEDLQLATIIHIAIGIVSFTLSTFPLLKLQLYTHTIIFSLSSKYFITFSYSTLARVHTHRVIKPRREGRLVPGGRRSRRRSTPAQWWVVIPVWLQVVM